MEKLTTAEKIDMIFIYGEARRNVIEALLLYAERYPERNVPSRSSFYRVVKTFSNEGNVHKHKRKRQTTVTGDNNEIAVLAAVAHNPYISSRNISRDSGISRRSVLRILRRYKFHPYHMSLHQELHGNDFQNRVTFCQWAQRKIQEDNNFFLTVLFSDESTFTNCGEVNRYNMHYWAVENPRWLREVEHQRPWNVNVWCGIIGDTLIGPHFFDGTLNGEKYRNFLDQTLPLLLDELPYALRLRMWFQQDGCPAHFSRQAREILDRNYNNKWIGRGGAVHWPARSPDLTPLDFFLWGFLKEKVYQDLPTTPENMKERIRNACHNIDRNILLNCHRSFIQRIQKCNEVHGHHFEHFIK